MPPSDRCTASTARGDRCRRAAMPGQHVCTLHAGEAQSGRPTNLTPATAHRIIQVLRAGGYVETAVKVAGVSPRTLRRWLKLGDPEGEDPHYQQHRELRAAIEQARGEAETRNVAIINQAAPSNWMAAAWLLERQYPERWGRPSQRQNLEPAKTAAPVKPDDPFAEVDELAERRRNGIT
jgi:hypothetical protein